MRITLSALLVSSLVLSGCGSSRLNPLNWFGKSRSQPVAAVQEGEVNPLIPTKRRSALRRPDYVYGGTAIDTVSELRVERAPGGAIVHASGVALAQGAFSVSLVPENDGVPVKGTLTYTLKAEKDGRRRSGSDFSRTVTVARFLTDQELVGVRNIRVVGARNVRTVRR